MKIRDTKINLSLFGTSEVVNATVGVVNTSNNSIEPTGLSEQMQEYYSAFLIDNAEPALVYDRFAQKVRIPKGSGKTIQFRKYNPLPTLKEAIKEGVTPTGQVIDMSSVSATLAQYGGYVELSDLLLMTAVDNNLVMATKLLGAQAGRTLDAITREVVCGGTNVQYGEGQISARHLIAANQDDEKDNCYLTVNAIRRAVRTLKNQNAEKINGSYIAIIHPDCAYDLMSDPNWKFPHQYANPENIFDGEIGKIEGVRFIESTEAKVFESQPILTISNDSTGTNLVFFNYSANIQTNSLAGKHVYIGGVRYYVATNTIQSMQLYTDSTMSNIASVNAKTGDKIYSDDCGKDSCKVYATMIFGDNAYGTTSVEGGGLEHIVKQLGSSGANDPLNQRATVGWKATKVTVRLVEAFMIRIETAASV